jgi:hypothetical protein
VHAARAFDFPGQDPKGYRFERRQLVANLPWQFNVHLGFPLVLWGLIAPTTPQLLSGNNKGLFENLGLWGDMSDARPRYSTGYAIGLTGFLFVSVSSGFYLYRCHIWRLASRPFVSNQRLVDGAFIAALMAQSNSNDKSADDSGHVDLITEAADLVRRVPMSKVTLAMLQASPRDENYDATEAFALGEDCGLGGIDYFVSHSWSDCPRQKFSQLCAVTLLFRQKHGRQPTFWLDKVCIDQQNIERTLRCLPVFEQACNELLILFGDSYASRLWCAR